MRCERAAERRQEGAAMPVLRGLAEELGKAQRAAARLWARGRAACAQAYPGEPAAAIESALATALEEAAGDEGIPAEVFTCERDFSAACPEGLGPERACCVRVRVSGPVRAGWADLGDGGN
eukprot:11221872-Alexandrium_andersonii.AAC.1